MSRSARLFPCVFACASLLLPGCAAILYTPANSALNDPDTEGCDRQAMSDALVASCRVLGEGEPLKDAAPFFGVLRRTTVADPYKLSRPPSMLAQFFFEFTPLGLFAPAFDYPPRETVYTGRVRIAVLPAPMPRRAVAEFEFRTDGSGRFEKILDLPTHGGARSGASPARTAPENVTLQIACRPKGCRLSSTSPEVASDGTVRVDRPTP